MCVELSWVGGEGGGPMDPRSGGSKGGGSKGGGSKGGGSKGGGSKGWGGAQNFAPFFSLSRHRFAFSVSLWGSSRGILVVFEAPGRSNVHVWSSRAVV